MITENIAEEVAQTDMAEAVLHNIDRKGESRAGVSLFHILTGASIVAPIVLFARGNKLGAIFVGLWPPTFQALKSASQVRKGGSVPGGRESCVFGLTWSVCFLRIQTCCADEVSPRSGPPEDHAVWI